MLVASMMAFISYVLFGGFYYITKAACVYLDKEGELEEPEKTSTVDGNVMDSNTEKENEALTEAKA